MSQTLDVGGGQVLAGAVTSRLASELGEGVQSSSLLQANVCTLQKKRVRLVPR